MWFKEKRKRRVNRLNMMKLLACFGNVWRFELIEVHSGRERSD